MSERTPQDVLRERLERDFASAFIRIRGAHNPAPGEPCAWCQLAAEQAAEAVVTTDIFNWLDKAIAEAPDSPPTGNGRLRESAIRLSDAIADRAAAGRSHLDVTDDADMAFLNAVKDLRSLLSEIAAPDTLSEKPGLDALVGQTTDRHPAALDVAGILAVMQARKVRLRGLWVQYHGDGTDRARRKGDVVVSVQYDHVISDAAFAEQGEGQSVREASQNLVARLGSTDSEGR